MEGEVSKDREVYVKVHEVNDLGVTRLVVGVCDIEHLGRVYEEGGVKLEVNKEFFGGFTASIDEALDYVKQAYTGILVGERVINEAIKKGLIHPGSVLKVMGVPYAHFVRM